LTAVKRIEALMDQGVKPGTPEDDELEVLITLVDAYESKAFPIDVPDPIRAIQFRMEQQGLSRRDIEPFIGSRARVSEVLTGKRPLTLEMVRRVRDGLGISADLLIEPHIPRFAANKVSPKVAAPKVNAKVSASTAVTAEVAGPLKGERAKSRRSAKQNH
jgi:HTH-type transcriptional regulator/antitoxin HigA